MGEKIVVFGYGPVGQATVERLAREGRDVRVAQRRRPANLPEGVEFVTCDVLRASDVMSATAGADQTYMFADGVHPTTKLHALFAQQVEKQIAAAGIGK